MKYDEYRLSMILVNNVANLFVMVSMLENFVNHVDPFGFFFKCTCTMYKPVE